MPAKNRAFDNNDDLDFGSDDLMGGDQGAPPGSDEFGEAEILKGD